ncbi:Uu.00g059910.m01.CDS01 [Anthostomella pinea]|uniref:Uu.00g059910.m01.CDS01 n=1 Tax=Anthostomella pinea TaxID=933095 RepID=A0AAI8VS39_9PEZI|nr:Uu.00g059910.m01.CDS01 [Anthostomella pinea]
MKTFIFHPSGAAMMYLEFPGTGRPLLMIHGLSCASSFEYPHVALSTALRGRHTILLDLPGYGYSDRPADFGYSTSDSADVVARFVRERGFETVDLYGHSMGGSVAIEVADVLGSLVHALVISEANLEAGGGAGSRMVAETVGGEEAYVATGHAKIIGMFEAEKRHQLVATVRATCPRAAFRSAKSLVDGVSPSWRSRLLKHSARKTSIFGDKSLPDPDYESLRLEGINVPVVSNASHDMGWENPDDHEVADILRRPVLAHFSQQRTLAGGPHGPGNEVRPRVLFQTAESDEERIDIAVQTLALKVARAMSIEVDEVEKDQPLHVFGVDSLGAVELRNWMKNEFAAQVPVFEITGGKTIEVIGELICKASEIKRVDGG